MTSPEGTPSEDFENENRRDDHLEREFGVTGRDYVRGSDRNDDVWSTRERERQEDRQRNISQANEDRSARINREQELFDRRMREQAKLDSLEARRRERSEVSSDDRDGLRFRDATAHSTAIAALESTNSVAGDETMENIPDEEHPMGADAKAG